MGEDRFEELLSRLLDDKLSSDELAELIDLSKRSPERQQELQAQLEAAELLAQSEDALRKSALFVAAVGSKIDEDSFVSDVRSKLGPSNKGVTVLKKKSEAKTNRTSPIWRWTIEAVAVIALSTALYLQRPYAEPEIARITGVSGAQLWTFDGGTIFRDLSIGTALFGGTVEGLTPDSWVELEFGDGSVVTISGLSMLTFSDNGQKILHLKEGNFSGSVQPQPLEKPMLVHTRTATLEVLGTQFNVDAGPFATTLSVSEGSVRAKRLSDGSTVDVPARHRVTAAPDREMTLVQVPDSVSHWQTQLHRGPYGAHGRWSPQTGQKEAMLSTVPYTTEGGKIIYTTGFTVSRGDNPPVVLGADSTVRVRGLITSAHSVWIGMSVRHTSGIFAGRFQIMRPAEEFRNGETFDVVVPLRDFHLDPTLNHMKSELPDVPFDLIVESVWFHSLYDQVGLAITEVELGSSTKGESDLKVVRR
ncbi:MAG: FecR family protein [Fuerstiella sp.]